MVILVKIFRRVPIVYYRLLTRDTWNGYMASCLRLLSLERSCSNRNGGIINSQPIVSYSPTLNFFYASAYHLPAALQFAF
jgi:hypothetical protein